MKTFLSLFNLRKPKLISERRTRHRAILDGIEREYSLYAVGDIHGCLKELNEISERIRKDIHLRNRLGIVVYLGDYVDRGPQSAGVLDHFCQSPPPGFRRLPLCGNHDDMFLDFLRDPQKHMDWLEMGGAATLQSYGINIERFGRTRGGRIALREAIEERVPPQHIAFLENLNVCARIGNLLFVHAGIRPGFPLSNRRIRI